MSSGWSEKKCFTIHVKVAPPAAPIAPPMPTTVETAVDGNMSVGVEKMICGPALMCGGGQVRSTETAGQLLCGKREPNRCGTKTMGSDGRGRKQQERELATAVDGGGRVSCATRRGPPPAMEPTLETA